MGSHITRTHPIGNKITNHSVNPDYNDVSSNQSTSFYSEGKHTLLIEGYLRNIQNTIIKRVIPHIVRHLIKLFYPNFTIYGIGRNTNGHLGISKYQLKTFTKLNILSSLFTNIDGIYSGWKRIIIKDIDNIIYGAGVNSGGQLGFGIGDENNEPIEKIRYFKKIPINNDKNKNIKNLNYFVSVVVRRTFLICNDEDGVNNKQYIYVCGANFKGECATKMLYNESKWRLINVNNNYKDKIINISGGFYHTLFLTQNGNVWSCGDNSRAQCGRSITNNTQSPSNPQLVIFNEKINRIYCGTYYNFCINDKTKNMFVFGSNRCGQLGLNIKLNDNNIINKPFKHLYFCGKHIIDIECGFGYTVCLNQNGICYLFGNNDCGQLSNGLINNIGVFQPYIFQMDNKYKNIKIKQIQAGGFHTVLLTKKTNNVITFGSNKSHQCSSLISNQYIPSGYLVDKQKEIGINKTDYIEKVVTQARSTLIVVNNHKMFRHRV